MAASILRKGDDRKPPAYSLTHRFVKMAFAGLADCYAQLGYRSYFAPEDSFPRARAVAMRALALDPALAEAHASLGFVAMYYDWDFT